MNSRKPDAKQQLVNRIRRLRGQLDAIERMITQDVEAKDVLIQIQACISAASGLKNNYGKYLILNSSLNDIRDIVDLLT